jgi:hypothetical protein
VRLTDLPGGELIAAGLDDLRRGRESVAALLVDRGPQAPPAGIRRTGSFHDPERRLYALLAEEDSDSAHGRYNALMRRLVSFERAAESLS